MRDNTKTKNINRRHVLGLLAGVAGVGITSSIGVTAPKTTTARWRGIALGGKASITLVHPDGEHAKKALVKVTTELKRLEAIFSLYDPASSLSQLNKDSLLINPPMELVSLLMTARNISELSNGHFDVTIQPLWDQLYGNGKSRAHEDALKLIGQERIEISVRKVQLGRGQSITLNGIAQGAITDHLINLLKQEGFDNMLLNTGEIRSLGSSPDGDPWQVALSDPQGPKIELSDMAVATSSVSANKAHLFNPRTSHIGSLFQTVSAVAPTATLADGLSTALSVTPEIDWAPLLQHYKHQQIYVYAKRLDGTVLKV